MSNKESATRARVFSEEGRKRLGHGKNKGRDMGGIKDRETLRNHCRVTEDGCWLYMGKLSQKRKGRSPSVFIRPYGKTLSLGSALHYIKYGKPSPKGYQMAAQCGNGLCCNPEHRKVMRPGSHMTIKSRLGLVDPIHAQNLRPTPRKLTDAQVVEIYNRRHEMSAKEQAALYGISESYAFSLRRGDKRMASLRLTTAGPAGMFSQLIAAANDNQSKRRA